jgi:hypothetical protein
MGSGVWTCTWVAGVEAMTHYLRHHAGRRIGRQANR